MWSGFPHYFPWNTAFWRGTWLSLFFLFVTSVCSGGLLVVKWNHQYICDSDPKCCALVNISCALVCLWSLSLRCCLLVVGAFLCVCEMLMNMTLCLEYIPLTSLQLHSPPVAGGTLLKRTRMNARALWSSLAVSGKRVCPHCSKDLSVRDVYLYIYPFAACMLLLIFSYASLLFEKGTCFMKAFSFC